MANKRGLKKQIDNVVNDLVEECYSYMLYNPGTKDKEAEAIIDQAANLKLELSARINESKALKTGKEMKSHFDSIGVDLQGQSKKLVEAIEKLDK